MKQIMKSLEIVRDLMLAGYSDEQVLEYILTGRFPEL